MRRLSALVVAASLLVVAGMTRRDVLPSWRDGSSRTAILDFVDRTTREGSPDYVAPAKRIAVFDNDGTLWAEQLMYVQLYFAVDRVKALAPQHPEWTTTEPFKSILAGDVAKALAGGEKSVLEIVAATHAGMTTAEFEATVKAWLATARHPTTGRLFTEMTYQPMVELLGYMREKGFRTYIVSGGGVEFMRPWTEAAYGIPPEQVIGSSGKVAYEYRDGVPVLVKLPEVNSVDDGVGKPMNINLVLGRRPIAAFGNSDGDRQMLEWTAAGPGARLCVIIHHTDATREWAYDRDSHIGRLDKALDEAHAQGWTVVDMAKDWATIFVPSRADAEGRKE